MLAVEQKHGVALLLAEDRDQHVADADFLLAARLHVEHRPLQHPLEAERRLHLALLAFLEARGRLIDVLLELLAQLREIRAAGAQHLAHLGGVEYREQQVLDRQILVTRLARLVKGVVEAVFELVGQHFDASLGLFQCAHQRMLVIARVGRHLRHLSFRDLICEDPAHALTLACAPRA